MDTLFSGTHVALLNCPIKKLANRWNLQPRSCDMCKQNSMLFENFKFLTANFQCPESGCLGLEHAGSAKPGILRTQGI